MATNLELFVIWRHPSDAVFCFLWKTFKEKF